MTAVKFFVPGEPVGKGRPRVGKIGQHVRMFTPAKTAAYEGLVAHAAAAAMAGRAPLQGACSVSLQVVCSIPQSWSQKKQRMALAGEVMPTGKPDADNVLKAMCDGMNGVVWRDDAQAVEVSVSKRYGHTPGVTVRVESLEAAPQAALMQEDALCA